MSVLIFLEQSRWRRPPTEDYFATIAAAAFEEAGYDDFCRRVFRLKAKFFKREGLSEFPLRGSSLLNRRALAGGYRKQEFVRELFSLCRLQRVTTFSTTRKYTRKDENSAPEASPIHPSIEFVTSGDFFSAGSIPLLLAYLIERANSFMLERHPGQTAKLIFSGRSDQSEAVRCSGFMHFIHKSLFGGGFRGILGTPLFMPKEFSPGLQVADVFAYIINQHHGGRRELTDYFREVESMQFVSSIEKDEYELRGMNLLE